MTINVTNPPILNGIGPYRAYRYISLHYLFFETVVIDSIFSSDILDLIIGSRTFIPLLEFETTPMLMPGETGSPTGWKEGTTPGGTGGTGGTTTGYGSDDFGWGKIEPTTSKLTM